MAELAPFRPLRFADRDLPAVVAPPYDVIDAAQRAALGAKSPHNIVHVDLPEGEGDAKYARAKALLEGWRRDGVLRQDARPLFLRYEQDFAPPDGGARVTRRGFFALVRADRYERRTVLPHERTLSGPKEDRYRLFCATKAALSPVFLLYRDPTGATRRALEGARPLAAFKTDDGIEHRVATLDDPETVARIVAALAPTSLLIADGHHRYETTVRYAETVDEECRAAGRPALERGSHRYVMAFLADADDPGLVVFPTHRLVHGLRGFRADALLEAAARDFVVTEMRADRPEVLVRALAEAGRSSPSVAAIFPDGRAAVLALKPSLDRATHPILSKQPAVLRESDVVVLHSVLLEGVLGVTREQQAAYQHLHYFKSTADALAAIRRGEGEVLFLMNPTPVDLVRRACEAGEVMPQKSTFFYPKVLTGVAIHLLDPHVAV